MMTLHEIIQFLKKDGAKGFIMDEEGDISYAIVPVEDLKRGNPILEAVKHDVEIVNKAIVEAQLAETAAPFVSEVAPVVAAPKVNPYGPLRVDLREEVIDPSFNFDVPQQDGDL